MTLTWKYSIGAGDVTLPYPENPGGFSFDAVPVVAAWRTLSGTQKQQYFAVKVRVSLTFRLLTATERNTLYTLYTAGFSNTLTMTFPDTKTGSYVTAANTWNERETWSKETPKFDVSFALDQV